MLKNTPGRPRTTRCHERAFEWEILIKQLCCGPSSWVTILSEARRPERGEKSGKNSKKKKLRRSVESLKRQSESF